MWLYFDVFMCKLRGKCLITYLLWETNDILHMEHELQFFQMRKLSPREVKGSFYVIVSNSQKVDGKVEPKGVQGWLCLLQAFHLCFFSCPTRKYRDFVWYSPFSSWAGLCTELNGRLLEADRALLFLRRLEITKTESLRACLCQWMRRLASAPGTQWRQQKGSTQTDISLPSMPSSI